MSRGSRPNWSPGSRINGNRRAGASWAAAVPTAEPFGDTLVVATGSEGVSNEILGRGHHVSQIEGPTQPGDRASGSNGRLRWNRSLMARLHPKIQLRSPGRSSDVEDCVRLAAQAGARESSACYCVARRFHATSPRDQ